MRMTCREVEACKVDVIISEADIEPISIRGRVAFGVACLENVCWSWGLVGKEFDQLLKKFWDFTESLDLCRWEREVAALIPDTIQELAQLYPTAGLTPEQVGILFALLQTVWEIAIGNAYGAFRSGFTLLPTLDLVGLMQDADVYPPDIRPFKKSPVSEDGGWGRPVPRSFFAE